MRVLVIAFLLAGCVGPADVAQEPATPTDDPEGGPDPTAQDTNGPEAGGQDASEPTPRSAEVRTTWRTERVDFTITDAVKTLGAIATTGTPKVEIEGLAATAVLVELDWASEVFDLDLAVNIDGGCARVLCAQEFQDHWLGDGDDANYWIQDGHLGAPDRPVRLLIDEDAVRAYGCDVSCDLGAYVWTKDVVHDVDGALVVTVFDGPVPAGFSAL